MNMCLIPNGFRYLARSIFHRNSQLTLHTDSHASDGGALQWEGKKILLAKFKILRAKYREPFGIRHMFI
jgi:hypothetical protein